MIRFSLPHFHLGKNTNALCWLSACFLSAFSAEKAAATTATLLSKSIKLYPSTQFIDGTGTTTNYFSTFNGIAGNFLVDSANPSGSGELRQKSGAPGLYEGGFEFVTSTGVFDYGSYEVNVPTTDSSGGGIPDVLNPFRGAANEFSIAGTGYGTKSSFPITFTFYRSPDGSTLGSYNVTTTPGQFPLPSSSGNYTVPGFEGDVYIEGANTLFFDFESLGFPAVPLVSISGYTTYTVIDADHIHLDPFVLHDDKGLVSYSVLATTLTRMDTGFGYFIGDLQVTDGLAATSWPDYTHFALSILEQEFGDDVPPSITAQPRSVISTTNASVEFTVTATRASSYQWNFNGAPIPGALEASYSLYGIQARDAGVYTVSVTNFWGTITSAAATLSVNSAPAFISTPSSLTVADGSTVILSSQVSGSPTPTLQWNLNGAAIPGATSALLVISRPTAANAGSYTVTATNLQGSITSPAAVLTVNNTADVGRLINLSINAVVGAGAQAMTMGFVTGGSGTTGSQNLLIRAVGPNLSRYGVTDALPDPALKVFDSMGAVIISNAGWGTPPSNAIAVTAADAATFASTLTDTTSLDSATVAALATVPSGYTVGVAGGSGDSGQVVAEVYDYTPSGSYAATIPRLVNVSCRIQVAAGSNLTAGFVIGGTTSKTVLIRAVGPTLTIYGVSGVMPDPQLTVFNNGGIIAYDAGWGGDPQLNAAMAAVYAFPFSDPGSKDSAVLLTLAPGSYTAQVDSASNTSGTTLVEVYEVP